MSIVITGASGQLGRLSAEVVLDRMRASEVILTTRRPEALSELAERGARVRLADFDRPETLVSREDCAAAAAAVLSTEGHEDKAYDITGPQALSQSDVAALLSEVSGRPVEAVAVEDEAFIEGLTSAGVPEPAAREIASYGRAIREGYIDQLSDAVENLTARPPRSLREVFEAHRDELLQGVSG